MDNNAIISDLKSVYSESTLSIICLDSKLDRLYCNRAARLAYSVLCAGNGIKRFLSEDEQQYVISALSERSAVRICTESSDVFDAVTFVAQYSRDGEIAYIRLQVEDAQTLSKKLATRFSNFDFDCLLENEVTAPAFGIKSAIDMCAASYSGFAHLQGLLKDMSNDLYKLTRFTNNMAKLAICMSTGYSASKSAFGLRSYFMDYASTFGFHFSDETNLYNYVVFVDPKALTKAMFDVIGFLNGFESIATYERPISVKLTEEADNIAVSVSRSGIRNKLKFDAMSATVDEKSGLHLNLMWMKSVLESIGGFVDVARPKNKMTVTLHIPKLFNDEEDIVLAEDDFSVKELCNAEFWFMSDNH